MVMLLNPQGKLLNDTIPAELGQLTNLTTVNLSLKFEWISRTDASLVFTTGTTPRPYSIK